MSCYAGFMDSELGFLEIRRLDKASNVINITFWASGKLQLEKNNLLDIIGLNVSIFQCLEPNML